MPDVTDQSPGDLLGTRVQTDAIPILFMRCEDDVEKFGPLWQELETRVGLRGRKFYGAFFEEANEYHVCVRAEPTDDPDDLGLETGLLPGGTYLRMRLRGEAPAVYSRIGPTFVEMMKTTTRDRSRPQIEFYRAHGVIDCLLPV